MKSKLSKNYIAIMKALSKDKIILYTTEKRSWRNCWLLFRSGKRIVRKINLVIGYREYAADERANYWYYDLNLWFDSSTKKPVSEAKQILFSQLKTNETGLEIKIDK